ncbi:MAG: TMEM165/GDT1 family protein [Clostridia bacterium]|nr:TMEM165/GDT1 family protein [Clostridia bacterium]
MEALYPFFIAFTIIFLAELGDKTQLLVMSFASKSKIRNILLGVALGTLLSHGIAIIFGSKISYLQNKQTLLILKIITNLTFLIIGILGFIPQKENSNESEKGILKKLTTFSTNYIFIVALAITVGELGDKTFLASIGLGFEYPNYKLSLIAGAILGMVVSNFIAIAFGKFLESKISSKYIKIISSIVFIIFGIVGLWALLF